jgi:hypothetical protein
MNEAAILWKRLDRPGHESARVREVEGERELSGCAVFVEAGEPVCLTYRILCDGGWRTRTASVRGWVGATTVDLEIAAAEEGEWTVNGQAVPGVNGCVDVDLNFSPSTNLLPVRRLGLAVGESAPVRAAWLRFPSFSLEVLEQVYRRTGAHEYEYSSAGGSFTATLQVDDSGFPVEYAGVWLAEA